MFIYAKFRLDVAYQKLLKSANVSQSYSKNKSWLHFRWPTLYKAHHTVIFAIAPLSCFMCFYSSHIRPTSK